MPVRAGGQGGWPKDLFLEIFFFFFSIFFYYSFLYFSVVFCWWEILSVGAGGRYITDEGYGVWTISPCLANANETISKVSLSLSISLYPIDSYLFLLIVFVSISIEIVEMKMISWNWSQIVPWKSIVYITSIAVLCKFSRSIYLYLLYLRILLSGVTAGPVQNLTETPCAYRSLTCNDKSTGNMRWFHYHSIIV